MTKDEREKRDKIIMRYKQVFELLTNEQRKKIAEDIKNGKAVSLQKLEKYTKGGH